MPATKPLTAKQQRQFREIVQDVAQRPNWTMRRLAQELGYGDASPLHKMLRMPKRVTTTDRLEHLQQIAAKATGTSHRAAPAKPTAATKSKPVAKSRPASRAAGTPASHDDSLVSKAQAKRFAETVHALTTPGSGLTVERLAHELGFAHTSSLYKAMRRGRVVRARYEALMARAGATTPAAAAPAAPTPTAAPKATATTKAAPTAAPKTAAAPANARLSSAVGHLAKAKADLERAARVSTILAPGLEPVIAQIAALEETLSLA